MWLCRYHIYSGCQVCSASQVIGCLLINTEVYMWPQNEQMWHGFETLHFINGQIVTKYYS